MVIGAGAPYLRHPAVVVPIISVLFAACIASSVDAVASTDEETRKMATKQLTPTLRLKCRAEDGRLLVEYAIENPGPAAVVVYDGAPGDATSGWPDLTDQVYVSFRAPDSVELLRIRAPMPAGRRITQIRVPSVSVVSPGQTRVVRFSLALPLVERSEYSPAISEHSRELRTARSVVLTIGYFPQMRGTKLIPMQANPAVFRVEGEYGAQQFVTASASTDVPVESEADKVPHP